MYRTFKLAFIVLLVLFTTAIYFTDLDALSQGLTTSLNVKQVKNHTENLRINKKNELYPSHRNRTKTETRILIYNRVPKCGSTTMQTLLRNLARKNNFTHHSSPIYGDRRLSTSKQKKLSHALTKEISTVRWPLSMDRHFYFVHFDLYGVHPVYINMLRDPVQRVISLFYYTRSPERWERFPRPRTHSEIRAAPRIPRSANNKISRSVARQGGGKSYYHGLLLAAKRRELASSQWARKNLTSCVLDNDSECAFVPGSTRETAVTYFCGSDPPCLIVNGNEALQRAKYNLETIYSVVGIVEELDSTLAAMEMYIPRYFLDARRTFCTMRKDWRRRNSTPHPEVPEIVIEILKRNLTSDIDLYKFAKQRLHLQLEYLGLVHHQSCNSSQV